MSEKETPPPVWVATPDALKRMAEQLRTRSVIGLDTEFIRETTFFPKIALIQIATEGGTWLVDPVPFDAVSMEPLLEILRDPMILKVLHAAYGDQECLFWSYKMLAAPVLDTAVAAALSGYGDNIGLAKLVREVFGVHLPKGRARVKWLQRPLSRELLHYAQQDVAHLVPLARTLEQRLRQSGRWEWALEESKLTPEMFDESPTEIAARLAKNGSWDGAGIVALENLVAWREKRARSADIPRGWIADNDVLAALARVRPRSIEELHSFRGLKPKEIDRSGLSILELLRAAEENPATGAPNHRRSSPSPEYDEHALDLLKAFIALMSARHQIATRFLLPQTKMLLLLHHYQQQHRSGGDTDLNHWVEAWVGAGFLTPAAAQLIGSDLQSFLSGHKGLSMKRGRVQLVELA